MLVGAPSPSNYAMPSLLEDEDRALAYLAWGQTAELAAQAAWNIQMEGKTRTES